MDKDCTTFENHKKVKNKHINHNQKEGRTFFLLVLFFLLSLGLIFIRKKIAVFSIILFFVIVYIVLTNPIIILRSCDYYINKEVDTPPFLELEKYFPNYKYIEENTSFFQKELNQLLEKTHNGKDIQFTKDTYGNEGIGRDVDEEKNRGWRVFHVKIGKNILESGKKNFPKLVETIKKYPEIINVTVSILDGKTKIPMHVGYYKGIMRYMLPLKIPKNKDDCFLCVNGDKYVWEEGKSLLWDDNFPHKVYNHTEETRVVIYMDIERPLLDWKRKKLNKIVNSIFSNSSIIKNEVKKTETKQKIE